MPRLSARRTGIVRVGSEVHSDLNKSRVSLWLLSVTAVAVAVLTGRAGGVTMSSLPTESPARVRVAR